MVNTLSSLNIYFVSLLFIFNNILLVIVNSITYCDDEMECEGSSISDIDELRCRGYISCRSATLSISDTTYCNGNGGCSYAIIDSNYVVCSGNYGCNYNEIVSSYMVSCVGNFGCNYSKIGPPTNQYLDKVLCNSYRSCNYAEINNALTLNAYSLNSIRYADININNHEHSSSSSGDNSDPEKYVNIGGYYAGQNTDIYCDHDCEVNCQSWSSCVNTNVYCVYTTSPWWISCSVNCDYADVYCPTYHFETVTNDDNDDDKDINLLLDYMNKKNKNYVIYEKGNLHKYKIEKTELKDKFKQLVFDVTESKEYKGLDDDEKIKKIEQLEDEFKMDDKIKAIRLKYFNNNNKEEEEQQQQSKTLHIINVNHDGNKMDYYYNYFKQENYGILIIGLITSLIVIYLLCSKCHQTVKNGNNNNNLKFNHKFKYGSLDNDISV